MATITNNGVSYKIVETFIGQQGHDKNGKVINSNAVKAVDADGKTFIFAI